MYGSHEYDRITESFEGSSMTGSTYQSAISRRPIEINRPRNTVGNNGVVTRMFQSFHSTGGSQSFGPGLASLVNSPGVPLRGSTNSSNSAIVEINVNRQRDKRDLTQLNDKFAQYIEKVRFLEAQNRKLVIEIDALKSRAGQGSSRIKEMYDIEMSEANKLIDGTKRDAAAANMKLQKSDQDLNRLKARLNEVLSLSDSDKKNIEALQQKFAENQAQINLYRRRIGDLEEEALRHKSHAQRILSEINRLQNEIQSERFLKTSCDVEKAAMQDELETLKARHEADLSEIRARAVSNDLDPSKFFRNELAQAIQEIRHEYENRNENQRQQLQNNYMVLANELTIRQNQPDANALQSEQQRRNEARIRSEVSEHRNRNAYLQAENQSLKNRIDDLQRNLQRLKEDGAQSQGKLAKDIDDAKRRLKQADQDFQEVTNMKTSLEKEITTYRDLLESQNGLRGYVDRIVSNVDQQNLNRLTTGGASSADGVTSISRTVITSAGVTPGFTFSGPSLSTLVGKNNAAAASSFQTLSSGFRSSVGDSTGSDGGSRRSADFQ